jgi:hypothetical protein
MPAAVLTRPAPPLSLPSVTLLAATSVAAEATARAIELSAARIAFGEVLWISDLPPPVRIAGLARWVRIPPLAGRDAYSRFMLRDLAALLGTEFILCVQWDGHVLEPEAWEPAFLDYDYIGAVWPHFRDGRTVGNGGFSLRSRRLLEACARLPDCRSEPEDLFICRTMRPQLERDHAIRFAPPELAERFAFERKPPRGQVFGFHGCFNLVKLLPDREAAGLIRELPLHALARNELHELLGWSLRRGRMRLASELFRRWLTRRREGRETG